MAVDETLSSGLVKKSSGTKIKTQDDANLDILNSFLLGRRNFAINGAMRVGQRDAITLGASHDSIVEATYSKVDRFAHYTTQTASAGINTQLVSGANTGDSGYAIHWDGVTLGAGGKMHSLYRIEAKDGALLKGKAISIQFKNYHNIGSPKTVTIYVRDADVADTFSATSAIANNGGTSIADVTDTLVKYEALDLTSYNPERGLEIEIEMDCGAIAAKDWEITDFQIEIGSVITPFEHKDYATELSKCQRYARPIAGEDELVGLGIKGNATQILALLQYSTMRVVPTLKGTAITTWATSTPGADEASAYAIETAGYLTITGALTISILNASLTRCLIRFVAGTSFSGTIGEACYVYIDSTSDYYLEAEL